MALNITPDMIADLHDAGLRTSRADQTGIVLGSDGWETAVWTGAGPDTGLVALTAADIYGWLDGTDLDDDAVAALTVPSETQATDYRILSETGSAKDPGDVTWQVCVGDATSVSWTDAFWFDMDKARELVAEPAGLYEDKGRASSLWITAEGTYLIRTQSKWVGEPDDQWLKASMTEAVEFVYGSDQDLVVDELPPVLSAARHAAGLVAELAPPQVGRNSDPDVDTAIARRHAGEAAEVVHAAKVLAELVRTQVLSDLRDTRGRAAWIVVRAHDGDRNAAAEQLGMSYPTLSGLL
ncbi:MAG TPA: hypothetical protein VIS06_16260 [Mycobacteriales bacterium]